MALKYTDKELAEVIEAHYGFPAELVENPVLCGLWFVRFTVKGIRYCGSVCHSGALPMISVDKYESKMWQGVRVSDDYYKKYIEGKKIVITKYVSDSVGRENTDIIFDTEDEAIRYIESLGEKGKNYYYDVLDD